MCDCYWKLIGVVLLTWTFDQKCNNDLADGQCYKRIRYQPANLIKNNTESGLLGAASDTLIILIKYGLLWKKGGSES